MPAAAPAFPVAQLPAIDRNVLRLAIYELLRETDVPPKAAINEAVELAKRFGGDNSGRFVNGVLGTIAARIDRRGRRQAQASGARRRRGGQKPEPETSPRMEAFWWPDGHARSVYHLARCALTVRRDEGLVSWRPSGRCVGGACRDGGVRVVSPAVSRAADAGRPDAGGRGDGVGRYDAVYEGQGIVSERLGVDEDKVTMEAEFIGDLNADSLDSSASSPTWRTRSA